MIKDTVIASQESSRVEAAVSDDPGPSKPTALFPETLADHACDTRRARPAAGVLHAAAIQRQKLAGDRSRPRCSCPAKWASTARCGRARAQVMGREYAAVALAIVSTRPTEAFHQRARRILCRHAAEIREKPRRISASAAPCGSSKTNVWGKDGHKERRKIEQQRRIEMRTKQSMHPDLQPAPKLQAPERASNASGGFVPVGSALPQQPTAWPMPPARPRPACRCPAHPKTGNRRRNCAASRRSGGGDA